MKQIRGTLILLALAVGGALYLWFAERGPSVEEGNVVLLRAPRDQIQTIELASGESGVKFTRDGELWRVAPLEGKQKPVPADEDAVNSLIQNLELVQSEFAVEKSSDLKAYGLEKPTTQITVDGETLEFGSAPPFAQGQIYARGNGKIALVNSALADETKKPFEAWRDTRVLRFTSAEVEKFAVNLPAVKAEFQKNGENWRLISPIQADADVQAVSTALTTLESAKWANSLETSVSPSTGSILVGDATLSIGAKTQNGFTAKNSGSPQAFVLPQTVFSTLNKPLSAWRDRDVARVDFDNATRLTLDWNGTKKTWEKEKDWVLEGTNDTAKSTRILDVLFWVDGLRAQEFVDAPKEPAIYGLDKPLLVVAMKGGDEFTLRVGQKNGKTFARRGDGPVYELEKSTLEGVRGALNEIFKK